MRLRLTDFGRVGIVTDRPDHELPIGAWSDGNNVVFRDGWAGKIPGNTEVYASPSIRPQWAFNYKDPANDNEHWIYVGWNDSDVAKIYSVTAASHTDRTRSVGGAYSFTPGGVTLHSNLPVFTSAVLNGLPILNCSSDIPQKWDRTGGALNATVENMTNWPSTWTCKSLRAFKGFLIAMDIDDSTATPTRNPYRLAWSDVIDTQFSEPSTWTAAASNLAGDVFLTDTDGYVQDAIELRGNMLVFKEDATYLMSYVGGNAVFSFRLLFNKHGLLAPNCAAKIKGERVFFVTKGDIMVTDGNTAESIADSRVREKIFSEIDTTYYEKGGAFCVEHYAEEEIWFCYSTGGDSLADKAAIWNYETGAWSFRSLNDTPCIAPGFVEITGGAWSDYAGAWSAETTIWAASLQSPGTDSLLILQRGDVVEGTNDTIANAKFFRADDSHQFDGVSFTSYLTRTGLDMVGEGVPQQQPPLVKFIRRLYPKINGGPVDIKVGYSMNEAGPYSWTDPVTYTPEDGDYKVDLRATGRYFGIDIRSTGDTSWELNSLDVEMEVTSDGR